MAQNGISTLSTKQAKQKAKLDLAQADRERLGNPRSAYDINRLPTKYSNDSLVDNPNAGGLILGRPWVSFQSGIYKYRYSGYWNGTTSYVTSNTPTNSSTVSNFEVPNEPTSTSEMFVGYILPDYTGTWTFTMYSDDKGSFWIGPNAQAGYTTSNALINANVNTVTGTIDLVTGSYYPIRVIFGNNGGPGSLSLSYSHTGQSTSTNFTGKLFYNPVTNGI